MSFSVNKIVQWRDESLVSIREGRWGSSTNANKQKKKRKKNTRLLTGFGAVMTTLISSVHKAGSARCDSAGRAGFYTHTLAVDSFPSVQPFVSPSLHPYSPFSKSSLLSENNPAIRCVNKQDHELISRTSQSRRPTWCQFSLVCSPVFYSLWSSVITKAFRYLNGLGRIECWCSCLYWWAAFGWEMFVCSSKAELIHRALCHWGNMAEEK